MWTKLLPDLKEFYSNCNLADAFIKEEDYLKGAFYDIDALWNDNFNNKIKVVNYIMLSEAPLWGKKVGKYIYNTKYNHDSSFFRCSDLSYALNNKPISSKIDLIKELNEIGFLIVDVSPFTLNKEDTSINYTQLSGRKKNNYYNLIKPTLRLYLDDRLSRIVKKIHDSGVKIFYRFPRIEKQLGAEISVLLQNYNLNILQKPLNDVFNHGGGINRKILTEIISKPEFNSQVL
jgi:hypothetical protein